MFRQLVGPQTHATIVLRPTGVALSGDLVSTALTLSRMPVHYLGSAA